MKRSAFTLIELVVIMVVVSILLATAHFRYERDDLAEVAQQVLHHIRYTQHLAMQEDKFDPADARYAVQPGHNDTKNGMWFRGFWRIRFYSIADSFYYAIFSDRDRRGNIDVTTHTEPARDPQTHLMLVVNSPDETRYDQRLNLSGKYSIRLVQSTCPNTPTRTELLFDNYGRPYINLPSTTLPAPASYHPYAQRLIADCNITLTHASSRQAIITVTPETGYAFISAMN